MPYIGNTPALDYISYAVQNFTVTAGTTVYTLDYSVANENDIRLVINNVIQRPGASYAYSATGTTLTLTSATLSTDTMYAVFIGRAVQTVTPPANSITNTMLAPSVITGQTAETSVAGGDLVLLYDDSASALRKMTRTNFVSGIANTPNFRATMSVGTSLTNNTFTKLAFNTETYDTDNCYNTSLYRFTPTTSGKYLVIASVNISPSDQTSSITLCSIYKNGSEHSRANIVLSNSTSNPITVSLIELNGSSDYIEAFAYQGTGGTTTAYTGAEQTYFSAFRLI